MKMALTTSYDLPEPDKPVITISLSRGRSRSIFFRLWVRAPRMRMNFSMGCASSCLTKHEV